MIISYIVAMSENRVIGVENKLPWSIPEDLKRFKKITSGHPIIMGRRTYDSIGRILPNRTNIIVTRNPYWKLDGAITANSLEDAIEKGAAAPGGEEVFVIGGGELFTQGLDVVNKIYLTIVHEQVAGDVFFPELPAGTFVLQKNEPMEGSPKISFQELVRK